MADPHYYVNRDQNMELRFTREGRNWRCICCKCNRSWPLLTFEPWGNDIELAMRDRRVMYSLRCHCNTPLADAAPPPLSPAAILVCTKCRERECICLLPHGDWPAEARAKYIAEPRQPRPRAPDGLESRGLIFEYLPPQPPHL